MAAPGQEVPSFQGSNLPFQGLFSPRLRQSIILERVSVDTHTHAPFLTSSQDISTRGPNLPYPHTVRPSIQGHKRRFIKQASQVTYRYIGARDGWMDEWMGWD